MAPPSLVAARRASQGRPRWPVAAVLVLSCVLAAAAQLPGADAYAARYIGLRYLFPIPVPEISCKTTFDGFLPNLYTPARDALMRQVVAALAPNRSLVLPLSGTIRNSLCSQASDCVWQWHGGPFENFPLTFFVGLNYSGKVPTLSDLFHRWIPGGILPPLLFPRAGFLTSMEGWRSTPLVFPSRFVTCEVTMPTTSGAPAATVDASNPAFQSFGEVDDATDANYVDPAAKGSSSKWWIGVIVGVLAGVILIAALAVVAWRVFFHHPAPAAKPEDANAAATGIEVAPRDGQQGQAWSDADVAEVDQWQETQVYATPSSNASAGGNAVESISQNTQYGTTV